MKEKNEDEMRRNCLQLMLIALILFSCKKDALIPEDFSNPPLIPVADTVFTPYYILSGKHYCDKSRIEIFTGDELRFKVRFDSTVIYQSSDPQNQADINKLYGFSEGVDNHLNSARIGWNWMNNALHLYAYTYSNGSRAFKEIKKVSVGDTVNCCISIERGAYLFKVDENKVSLPRMYTTDKVNGFKQFPYFGGDEMAPHDITIFIQDL